MATNETSNQPIPENSGYANPFLSVAMKKLYLNTTTADVHFVFEDKKKRERVPAHKSIMAAHCDAFEAMFYGDLSESGEIPVLDASANAFKEFLKFFYLEKINLTMDNIYDVVNLGKKYLFSPCLSICERFLMDSLSIENVCLNYEWAKFLDLNDLDKKCTEMIERNTEAVLQTNSFLQCSLSTLSYILKLEKLSCDETKIFYLCMNWVKEVSKVENLTRQIIDEQLGGLFYEIRFGSMSLEEINALSSTCADLFSSEEYKEIFQINVPKDFQSTMFKREPRRMLNQWNKDEIIKCYRVIERYIIYNYDNISSWHYFHDVESTVFSTNKPILLGEIVCAQTDHQHAFPIEIIIFEQLIERSNLKIIYIQKITTPTNPNQSLTTITMDKAILIKPNCNYEIQFKKCQASYKFYTRQLKVETQLPNTDIVIKFDNSHIRQASFIIALNFNLISSV